MSEKYDVIIIGAGIGGLTAGCYLAKAGFKVLLIEQQDKPGGYCTSFQRKGFRFDSAVHYIGSVKRGILSTILSELNLTNLIKFHQFDPTDKIIMPENETFIRANPYDTKNEFIKSFPRENTNITNFFNLLIEEDFFSLSKKTKNLSFKELLDNFFMDERLKATLSVVLGNMGSSAANTSALGGSIFYREFILDPGYYPLGGIQTLPNALIRLFESNHGEKLFLTKVSKILVENNQASGVQLSNGEKIFSKIVISNADATLTYRELLKENELKESKNINSMKPSNSAAALYLGVRKDIRKYFSECGNIWISQTYKVEQKIQEVEKNILKDETPLAVIYSPSSHDPDLENGNHTIQALINAPYQSVEFWKTNKEMIVDRMFSLVKKIIPDLDSDDVVIKFGASPVTFKRYTSNYRGAIYGWESSLAQSESSLIPQKSSLPNLYLAGHWCTTGMGAEGGISGAAIIGRNAARLVSRNLGKDWEHQLWIIK